MWCLNKTSNSLYFVHFTNRVSVNYLTLIVIVIQGDPQTIFKIQEGVIPYLLLTIESSYYVVEDKPWTNQEQEM